LAPNNTSSSSSNGAFVHKWHAVYMRHVLLLLAG
jgi:hypothetical protein